jgi:hypothetical protein
MFVVKVRPTNTTECICASTDLVNWTNLRQVRVQAGTPNFLDTNSANYQVRFYRPYLQ